MKRDDLYSKYEVKRSYGVRGRRIGEKGLPKMQSSGNSDSPRSLKLRPLPTQRRTLGEHATERTRTRAKHDCITITGARQNNLKNITVQIPFNPLTVVTGVSGSGKSSLAFDILYAEGQRRYVESFSAYARQFLDRMDKPRSKRSRAFCRLLLLIRTDPVRTSRSTVGTMTELHDHLKLLFAKIGVSALSWMWTSQSSAILPSRSFANSRPRVPKAHASW